MLTRIHIAVKFGGASIPKVHTPAFLIPSESICDALFDVVDEIRMLRGNAAIQTVKDNHASPN